MDRRTLILSATALAACADTSAQRRRGVSDFLRRAMDEIGGEDALRSAKVLEWDAGQAYYSRINGSLSIETRTRTVFEPFEYVREEHWILGFEDEPPSVYEINYREGWEISNGTRSVLDPIDSYFRSEFGVFGLMRLIPMLDGSSEYSISHLTSTNGQTKLFVAHPHASLTTLTFDATPRILRAAYSDGDTAWRVDFSGRIEGGGIIWPDSVAFYRRGRLDRQFSIDTFATRQQR